jgi:3-phenylpropionate/cinnamic acid dioxygenase small subunit
VSENLEELTERTRIIEQINRLFISTDNRDWEAVKNCFASKVLFDMSSMGTGDPKEISPYEIVAMWETGLKPLHSIHHQTGNFMVKVKDAEADAFCYGIAIHYLPNKTNNNTRTFVGSYEFSLEKDTDTWKIRHFKFNLKFIDGNKELEAE